MEADGQVCSQLYSQNKVCGEVGTILRDMWILFIIASKLSCYDHNNFEKTASKASTKLCSIVLIVLVIIMILDIFQLTKQPLELIAGTKNLGDVL